jgi:DNA-binding beta-propeller fold protein YncE
MTGGTGNLGRRGVLTALLGGLLAACGRDAAPVDRDGTPLGGPPAFGVPTVGPGATAAARPAAATPPVAHPAPAPSPRLAPLWASDGGPHPLTFPVALALDRRGDCYVVDAGNARLQVFDAAGRPARRWGGDGAEAGRFRFRLPDRCTDSYADRCAPGVGGGVAVDDRGRVYVADYANHRVQVFDRAGRVLAAWGREGGGPGEFRRPRAIAVDARGRVVVADAGNDRLQWFDPDGDILGAWGGGGALAAPFARPEALAADDAGGLAVLDADGGRVRRFDPDGRLLAAWTIERDAASEAALPAPPAGLGAGPAGQVLVAGAVHGLQQFDATGRLTASWGRGAAGGALRTPAGVAVDRGGDVYVADRDGHRVAAYRPLWPQVAGATVDGA